MPISYVTKVGMLQALDSYALIILSSLTENPLLEGREEQQVGADVEHTLTEVRSPSILSSSLSERLLAAGRLHRADEGVERQPSHLDRAAGQHHQALPRDSFRL